MDRQRVGLVRWTNRRFCRRRGHFLFGLVRRHILAQKTRPHAWAYIQQRADFQRRGKLNRSIFQWNNRFNIPLNLWENVNFASRHGDFFCWKFYVFLLFFSSHPVISEIAIFLRFGLCIGVYNMPGSATVLKMRPFYTKSSQTKFQSLYLFAGSPLWLRLSPLQTLGSKTVPEPSLGNN